MVVSSGQYPYTYDHPLPIRGSIGISGNILEQGMFVAYAELRKWGIDPIDSTSVNLYKHPNIAASGFDPKADGSTLGGDVAGPALVTIDNILETRNIFNHASNGIWTTYLQDSDHSFKNFMAESWLINAYPENISGVTTIIQIGPFISALGGNYLRPELDDVTGGNNHTDTDLHWLGGSGVFFDLDIGEVMFQPFPFLYRSTSQSPGGKNLKVSYGPFHPSFQKADGSLITLTGRETSEGSVPGNFRNDINFDAIASGNIQIDGYAILPTSRVRLITGNEYNYFNTLGGSSDFTFIIGGARQLGTDGENDDTARMYWTTQIQLSGVYSAIIDTPINTLPVQSGIVSLWPEIYNRNLANNFELGRSITTTSDNGILKLAIDSKGYHVFDDCIWLTSPNIAPSGDQTPAGLFPMSPHNGALTWFRPAQLTVASTGNSPASTDPGNFRSHVGLEPFGANEIIRLNRVHQQDITSSTCGSMSNNTELTHSFYFQRYSLPLMNYTETTEIVVFCTENLPAFNNVELTDLFFDGTSYWICTPTREHMARFDSALNFDGYFSAPSGNHVGGRRSYINGEYLYWAGATFGTSDWFLNNDLKMSNATPASGIGKFNILTTPVLLGSDHGTYSHYTAKPIRAETFVGDIGANTVLIHDIIDVDTADATHLAPGMWALMTISEEPLIGVFNFYIWLLRLEEQSAHYQCVEAINTGQTVLDDVLEYPIEIIHLDVD